MAYRLRVSRSPGGSAAAAVYLTRQLRYSGSNAPPATVMGGLGDVPEGLIGAVI